MATKTISIDIAAYDCLRKARSRPDESFSQVIKRGRWDSPASTGAALLEALKSAPAVPAHVIKRLEQAQASDQPPPDAWTE